MKKIKPLTKNSKNKKWDKKNFKKSSKNHLIRLNKFIANSGICSRREADKYIMAGVITVNGESITKMGYKISSTDIVRFNGEKINSEKNRYILLNKPKNYSYKANSFHNTMQLIKNYNKEKIIAVDNLNKIETGLLLFTNDIHLLKKLSNYNHSIKSIYHLTLKKKLTQSDFNTIKNGIIINNKKIFFESVSYVTGKSKNEIGIENSYGGIKLIKKVFEKCNYSILKIDRVYFAGLTKKDLPRKKFRHLTKEEITILKRI